MILECFDQHKVPHECVGSRSYDSQEHRFLLVSIGTLIAAKKMVDTFNVLLWPIFLCAIEVVDFHQQTRHWAIPVNKGTPPRRSKC